MALLFCAASLFGALEEDALSKQNNTELHKVATSDLSRSYEIYRILLPSAIQAMKESIERYGQLTPLTVSVELEIIDGFKRVSSFESLGREQAEVRIVDLCPTAAKAAIYCINAVGSPLNQLEEAYLVSALVRDDGLSQQQVAELFGRRKAWACRRLALVEQLCKEAQADLRVSSITPTIARELVRLPRGNQAEVLDCIHSEALTSRESKNLVDIFLSCSNRAQQGFVLSQARESILNQRVSPPVSIDPRLSANGQRLVGHLDRLEKLLVLTEFELRDKQHSSIDKKILAKSIGGVQHEANLFVESAADYLART